MQPIVKTCSKTDHRQWVQKILKNFATLINLNDCYFVLQWLLVLIQYLLLFELCPTQFKIADILQTTDLKYRL